MLEDGGVDITELDRVRAALEKNPHFAERVLTANELAQANQLTGQRFVEYVGGRWGLKESFAKAWGTGIGKEVGFQDLEILNNDKGKPVVTKSPYDGRVIVSVSHTKDLVMTMVLLERDAQND